MTTPSENLRQNTWSRSVASGSRIFEDPRHVGTRRVKGFHDTIKKHGLELSADYVIQVPRVDVDGQKSGALAMRRIKELDACRTEFFATTTLSP